MDHDSLSYIESHYFGNRWLQPIGDALGLRIDQANFIVAQLLGLSYAYFFKSYLTVDRVGYKGRLWGSIIPGGLMLWFCFGRDAVHLLGMGVTSYLTTIFCPAAHVHKGVMFTAFSYLSYLHIYRMYYDYGGYILDITGPCMIGMQKVTSLAFNLYDGLHRNPKDLSADQKRFVVNRMPSMLEYFSYLFTFQTLIAGPLVYYRDFNDFVSGDALKRHNLKEYPSSLRAVFSKFFASAIFAMMVLKLQSHVPIEYLANEMFLKTSNTPYYIVYCVVSTSANRWKYYFAWRLGEAICNASDLGFSGFIDGIPEWELVAGLDIWRIETANNFKILFDNWNKTTQTWLRRCSYERVPTKVATVATYTLSAAWHGFYPGYYLCFLTASLCTNAARCGRRHLRPLFQQSTAMVFIYDSITLITTRLMLAYVATPFALLSLKDGMKFYGKLYYGGHILAIVGLLLPYVPFLPRPVRVSSSSPSAKEQTITDSGDKKDK